MTNEIKTYHKALSENDAAICELLCAELIARLPEAEYKLWHGHPVWFLDGNPVAGYSKLKESVRLLLWSGQSFEEEGLQNEGKFKAAEKRYTHPKEVKKAELKRWLKKARTFSGITRI